MAQTRANGIVTALHEIPYGEVWTVDDIRARQTLIRERPDLGLNWIVTESLPVHEDIKRGSNDLARLFGNYRKSLRNLAECGGLILLCFYKLYNGIIIRVSGVQVPPPLPKTSMK